MKRLKPGDPGTVSVCGHKEAVEVLRAGGMDVVYDPLAPADTITVIRVSDICPHPDVADAGPDGGHCVKCGAWVGAK